MAMILHDMTFLIRIQKYVTLGLISKALPPFARFGPNIVFCEIVILLVAMLSACSSFCSGFDPGYVSGSECDFASSYVFQRTL